MRKNNSRRIIKRVALGLVLGILFLGAIWEYDGCDIAEGQNVKMLFDINDQSSKYDDIILKVWVAK